MTPEQLAFIQWLIPLAAAGIGQAWQAARKAAAQELEIRHLTEKLAGAEIRIRALEEAAQAASLQRLIQSHRSLPPPAGGQA